LLLPLFPVFLHDVGFAKDKMNHSTEVNVSLYGKHPPAIDFINT